MMNIRWRFSLRFLLLAAALIPLAAYWFALPTLYAQRFSAALARGDYQAAESLCLDREDPFPGHWKKHAVFQPRPGMKELTLSRSLVRQAGDVCGHCLWR